MKKKPAVDLAALRKDAKDAIMHLERDIDNWDNWDTSDQHNWSAMDTMLMRVQKYIDAVG